MNDDLRDNEKLYGERDPMAQDEAGGYFARHMHHMTTENLHSKAEIAEELAHRDIQIEAKDQRIAELVDENTTMRAALEEINSLFNQLGFSLQSGSLAGIARRALEDTRKEPSREKA